MKDLLKTAYDAMDEKLADDLVVIDLEITHLISIIL